MTITLTANQLEALRVLAVYTTRSEKYGPSMDAWDLAGPQKASCRAHVMALLMGVPKCPQSKAGVNAIRSKLYEMLAINGGCEAERETTFKSAAKGILGIA